MNDQSPTKDRLKLFISYSRRDMETADRLVAALEEQGFEVTIDRRDLPYGEEWQKELADFIRSSDTVLWLISSASVQSRWCNWELGEVQRLSKRLLPVAIEAVAPEALPEALGKIHVLPAEGTFDLNRHMPALFAALNTDRAWLKEHTRLADRARQWLLRERSKALLLRGVALKDAQAWNDRKPRGAPPVSDEVLELLLASRRAKGRRERIAVAASFAAAITGVGLAGLAYWQRGEAIRQETIAVEQRELAERNEARAVQQQQLAEASEARALEQQQVAEERTVAEATAREEAQRNFETARNTVDGLIVDITQGLRDVEGMPLESMQRVLSRVQTAVENLAETSPGDAALHFSRAAMFTEFGNTYLAAGEGAAAVLAYTQGLAILRDLSAEAPEDNELRENIGISLLHIGDAKMRLGDPVGSLAALNEALALLEEAQGEGADIRQDKAAALEIIGKIRRGEGDSQGALSAFEEGLSLLRALSRERPQEALLRRNMANMLYNIGDVRLAEGDIEGALVAYEESRSIFGALSRQDPGNNLRQHDLALILDKIGDVEARRFAWEAATIAYQQVLAIGRDLLVRDPSNTEWQRDVSIAVMKLADVRLLQGEAQEAIPLYEEGLAIVRRLVALDPDNLNWKNDLSVFLDRLGGALTIAGETESAMAAFEEGIAVRRQLVEADPDNRISQHFLALLLANSGDVANAAGNQPAALAAYEESLQIMRGLVAIDGDNTNWLRTVTNMLDRLGNHEAENGDASGALAAHEESLETRRRILELSPDDPQSRIGVVISLYNLALITEGEPRLAFLAEGIAILDELQREGLLNAEEQLWPAHFERMLAKVSAPAADASP